MEPRDWLEAVIGRHIADGTGDWASCRVLPGVGG